MRIPRFTPALTLLALALVLMSCDEAEEDATPTTTASSAASRSPDSSPDTATPMATVAPTTSQSSPPSAPAGWETYSDPKGLFTLRFPSSWFPNRSHFLSKDPATFTGPPESLPDEVVKVEAGYYSAVGSSGCGGALDIDSTTGVGTPTDIAVPASLGGQAAWQIVRLPGDPAIEVNLTRIQGISTIYKGTCFMLSAYFTQQDPDVDTFLKIAESYSFTH